MFFMYFALSCWNFTPYLYGQGSILISIREWGKVSEPGECSVEYKVQSFIDAALAHQGHVHINTNTEQSVRTALKHTTIVGEHSLLKYEDAQKERYNYYHRVDIIIESVDSIIESVDSISRDERDFFNFYFF